MIKSAVSNAIEALSPLFVSDSLKQKAIALLPDKSIVNIGFEHHCVSGEMDFGYTANIEMPGRPLLEFPCCYEFDISRNQSSPHLFVWVKNFRKEYRFQKPLHFLREQTGVDVGVFESKQLSLLYALLPAQSLGGFIGVVQRERKVELRVQFGIYTNQVESLLSGLDIPVSNDANRILQNLASYGMQRINLQLVVKPEGISSNVAIEIGVNNWADKPPQAWFQFVDQHFPSAVTDEFIRQTDAWWGRANDAYRWTHFKLRLDTPGSLKNYLWLEQ